MFLFISRSRKSILCEHKSSCLSNYCSCARATSENRTRSEMDMGWVKKRWPVSICERDPHRVTLLDWALWHVVRANVYETISVVDNDCMQLSVIALLHHLHGTFPERCDRHIKAESQCSQDPNRRSSGVTRMGSGDSCPGAQQATRRKSTSPITFHYQRTQKLVWQSLPNKPQVA